MPKLIEFESPQFLGPKQNLYEQFPFDKEFERLSGQTGEDQVKFRMLTSYLARNLPDLGELDKGYSLVDLACRVSIREQSKISGEVLFKRLHVNSALYRVAVALEAYPECLYYVQTHSRRFNLSGDRNPRSARNTPQTESYALWEFRRQFEHPD